jgi:hypothetical protein
VGDKDKERQTGKEGEREEGSSPLENEIGSVFH